MDIDNQIKQIEIRFSKLLDEKKKINFKKNYDYDIILQDLKVKQDKTREEIDSLEKEE